MALLRSRHRQHCQSNREQDVSKESYTHTHTLFPRYVCRSRGRTVYGDNGSPIPQSPKTRKRPRCGAGWNFFHTRFDVGKCYRLRLVSNVSFAYGFVPCSLAVFSTRPPARPPGDNGIPAGLQVSWKKGRGACRTRAGRQTGVGEMIPGMLVRAPEGFHWFSSLVELDFSGFGTEGFR